MIDKSTNRKEQRIWKQTQLYKNLIYEKGNAAEPWEKIVISTNGDGSIVYYKKHKI